MATTTKKMTNKQILKQDFYDLCGGGLDGTTNEEKIEWYKNNILNPKKN